MGSNYIFSLQPTFTQGLVFGQLSILVLLAVVLNYLFLDNDAGRRPTVSTFHPQPRREADVSLEQNFDVKGDLKRHVEDTSGQGESAEWFNLLLHHILAAYRSKLREDKPGAEGDEIARRKIEEFANNARPSNLLDPIQVHSVDLGSSAPRLFNGRIRPSQRNPLGTLDADSALDAELDVAYTDTLSISISTGVLFNYPMFAFARLPVSLTISLDLFQAPITLKPPIAASELPTLTITIPPDRFTLNLNIQSLLGSRAKLADVPKLHELIESQVRRLLAQKGTYTVVLPGLATVPEVKQAVEREKQLEKEQEQL